MKTDWDAYYQKPYAAAKLTRRYTQSMLITLIKRYHSKTDMTITELGGANSCFLDAISQALNPKLYHIIDNNQTGVDLFKAKYVNNPRTQATLADLTTYKTLLPNSDITFSVGLIEHFNPAQTADVIKAHFSLTRPGGVVILSYPTPTLLYKTVRSLAELCGKWIFHDERPLMFSEVAHAFPNNSECLFTKMGWLQILTQQLLVIRKS